MKIALIGYGKMGRAIESIALERGHQIVARIDIDNQADFDSPEFASADVAIEFTTPSTAVDNYIKAFSRGVPVVSGSTGWTACMDEIKDLCLANGYTFFWTSNFSIGVNIFFELNRRLAAMMNPFPQYVPEMTEIHHIHKLDHPSGTAITLAQGIEQAHPSITSWTEDAQKADSSTMLINHERQGEVPGTHIITWDSPVDSITIEHKAKSRLGFALGAVMAAEWAASQRGFLTMDMFMDYLLSKKN
ncbi:MAG: 4-hydroxy-tetrahydrodipicolinate reductase [Muribaculaceae bacterium]|nr:4-hydroxy-tetrahydrodipicolinate reductase [Muribaculaceae bacterium]